MSQGKDIFEDYAMLVSGGNADLHKDLHGNYDDPDVIILKADFVRKVEAQVFKAFLTDTPEGLPDICYQVADWWDGRKLQRRIVCAANRFKLKKGGGDLIVTGTRHYSKDMANTLDHLRGKIKTEFVTGDNQGFVDQWGNYFTRGEAFIIAYHAGQVNTVRIKSGPKDTLFSEDLY